MASSGFISRPITAIKTCLRNLILLLLRNFFFLVFVSWFAFNKKKGEGVSGNDGSREKVRMKIESRFRCLFA